MSRRATPLTPPIWTRDEGLGDDIVNWTIFAGTEPYDQRFEKIVRDDPDLVTTLRTLDLVMASRAQPWPSAAL